MKIFVICSKKFYDRIPEIQEQLEDAGHKITLPNSYDDPDSESRYKNEGDEAHALWKASMFKKSLNVIEDTDAVLVLNFEKDGILNYIGGATFIEMYDAFRLGKKIYLYNPVPEGILKDEINGFNPLILNGDLSRIP